MTIYLGAQVRRFIVISINSFKNQFCAVPLLFSFIGMHHHSTSRRICSHIELHHDDEVGRNGVDKLKYIYRYIYIYIYIYIYKTEEVLNILSNIFVYPEKE